MPAPHDPLFEFRRKLLNRLDERLLCIDVGARWGADGSLMLLREKAKLLCFDPDADECARLQAEHPIDQIEYVPLALSSDGRDLDLHLTSEPACSSIFEPIPALYDAYPALGVIRPVRVERVPSTTMDAFLKSRGLGKPDLVKLDTQGSELDILRGSIDSLARTCFIDVEVEFNAIYSGQALFSDVDAFLRQQGFALWRLQHLVHYTQGHPPDSSAPPITLVSAAGQLETARPGYGQLFWGQAHYVRQECLATSSSQIDVAFACRAAVTASAYGYWDLALMVLRKCPGAAAEAAKLNELLSAPNATSSNC